MTRDRANYNNWMRNWREKNRQRYLESSRKSYLINRDKIIERRYHICSWDGCCGKTTSRFCMYHSRISVSQTLKAQNRRVENSHVFKAGRKKSHGYWFILKPGHHHVDRNGYVLEHRLIYEQYYNCCVPSWVDCHHINENTEDNRIENLQLMTRSEHSSYHMNQKWKNGVYIYLRHKSSPQVKT